MQEASGLLSILRIKTGLDEFLQLVLLCFKDLRERTKASDKVLRNKSFNITENRKCGEYQGEFVSMVHMFLIKVFWW